MANEFLPLATGGGSNVITQSAWNALAARLTGFQAGVAKSDEVNKALRQATSIAAMIGQFISDRGGVDALDNADIGALLDAFEAAYRKQATNYIGTVGGTANALTVTLHPGLTTHQVGLILRLIPSATNTAGVTLDDGAGALPLRYVGGAELFAGELLPGRAVEVLCTGTAWFLMNPVEYFERQTPARSRSTRAFTAAVALSDVSGFSGSGTFNVAQTIFIGSTRWVDLFAACAFRNTSGTLVSTTGRLRLLQGSTIIGDSDYLGCATINSSQTSISLRAVFKDLNPSLTYAVQLLVQKGVAGGPVEVLDPVINALHE